MLIQIGKGGQKRRPDFFLTLATHKKHSCLNKAGEKKKIVFAHVKNKMKYEPYMNYAEIFWLDSFEFDNPSENAVGHDSWFPRKLVPRGLLRCFLTGVMGCLLS